MKKILLSVLAVLLLIEEWLWDSLSALGHYVVVHLGLVKFENWLMQRTPYQALVAISIPILVVTPMNIMAVWLFSNGMILQGIALEIAAKLFGTLFIARFFSLTKQQLLTFYLIASIYNTITYWLAWAHKKIIETEVYMVIKKLRTEVSAKLAAWYKKPIANKK